MNASIRPPAFGKFLDALTAAGVETGTARGFWGGVAADGEIIVTAWTDQNDGAGRFYIWRPKTNHGGLKTEWELGNIHVGAEVRMIFVRPRGSGKPRSVKDAALMPDRWRVVEITREKAIVEPIRSARKRS